VDIDEMFINTLNDLERRTTAVDEYEVLMSAALLRKLLMDSTPLMDRANQTRRQKIRFRINGETPFQRAVMELGPVFWSLEDGIDPELDQPPGLQAPEEVKRDGLLARRVMRLQGEWVTVRDLIDHLCHIEGAVHSQRPENRREELLREVAKQIYVGGLPAGIRQVRSIGRVVVRGLTPLRDAITSGQGS